MNTADLSTPSASPSETTMATPALPACASDRTPTWPLQPELRPDPLPLPIRAAPDPVDPDYDPLLSEPMIEGLSALARPTAASTASLRNRLFGRVSASRAASSTMVTSRLGRLASTTLAPGVASRTLYQAVEGRPLRPGEPWRARLLELQPGCLWQGPDGQLQRDWLVLRGEVRIGAEQLQARDYHVVPPGQGATPVQSSTGAWLFLRESQDLAAPSTGPLTTRDQGAEWPEFAPGVRRRVLWQQGRQAAMLYLTEPGATVPHHTHEHDEECLMVEGDLFLDDTLLRPGDYQLAPAGTEHRLTETDTGVVIYAHGDLDLQFVG